MPRRKWRCIQIPPAIGPAIFSLPCDSFHTYANRLVANFRVCTTLRDNSQSWEGCQKGLLKPNEWEQNQNEQIQPGYGQMRKDHQLKAAQNQNELGAHSEKDISNQQWISMQQLNQSAT